MRTYDRAEENNVLRWHEARGHIRYYWWDYDVEFKREDLRPFWEPDEDYSYWDDVDINDVHRGRLMTLLLKLRLISPRDVINDLNW